MQKCKMNPNELCPGTEIKYMEEQDCGKTRQMNRT